MNESFGARFARLRKSKGYTQEDIANRVNISYQAVSKWENDISSPDISLLPQLADILEVSIDELLGRVKPGEIKVLEEHERKDLSKMVFRIYVDSKDGDKIKVNLPLVLVKAFINSNQTIDINGKKLDGVDFKQVFELVEQGVVGEIVNIDSSDGKIVRIVVE